MLSWPGTMNLVEEFGVSADGSGAVGHGGARLLAELVPLGHAVLLVRELRDALRALAVFRHFCLPGSAAASWLLRRAPSVFLPRRLGSRGWGARPVCAPKQKRQTGRAAKGTAGVRGPGLPAEAGCRQAQGVGGGRV